MRPVLDYSEDFQRRLVLRIGRRLAFDVATVFHNLDLAGPCPLPTRGGAILTCNHISSVDPIFLQAASSRLISWMVAAEYYHKPGNRWFCDLAGAIPVQRSGRDLAATRAALRALDEGRVVGIFPEGRIAEGGEVLPFQAGIGLLAVRSGAPVYPAYIEGTQRGKGMAEAYLQPQRARLAFGAPLQFGGDAGGGAGRAAVERATEAIREAVLRLRGRASAACQGRQE